MKRVYWRGLGIFVCMMLILLLSKQVQADVIWTPNDDFFNKHYEECEKMLRSFTANGEKGYVEITKDPISMVAVKNVSNGTEFYVSFTYTDKKDRVWGVVEYEDSTGWILMEELTVIYDNISFMEEHEDEIRAYEGEFDDYVPGKERIQFYEYPGSGMATSAMDIMEDKPEISYTYKDAEGRLWGYIGYYFAHRGWICIDDPTNANIPGSEKQPEATIIPPATQLPDPSGSLISLEVVLTAVLVVAVVLATVVIIRIFWKKK